MCAIVMQGSWEKWLFLISGSLWYGFCDMMVLGLTLDFVLYIMGPLLLYTL